MKYLTPELLRRAADEHLWDGLEYDLTCRKDVFSCLAVNSAADPGARTPAFEEISDFLNDMGESLLTSFADVPLGAPRCPSVPSGKERGTSGFTC